MGEAAIDRMLLQAVEHYEGGQPDQAEALCADILTAQPDHLAALHLSAVIAFVADRAAEGAKRLAKVFSVDPGHAGALATLGDALAMKGEHEGAVGAFERAVARQPRDAGLHAKLGASLCDLSRFEEAEASLRRALALDPGQALAQFNLAVALAGQGRFLEAEEVYRAVVARDPACHDAWLNLGNVLSDQDKRDEAVALLRRAIEVYPSSALAHSNLAIALRNTGELDEALAVSHRAVELSPDDPSLHYNHAVFLLMNGDFRNGFEEFRWVRKLWAHQYLTLSEPEWQGEPFPGRTLLLYSEHGFGDALQFVRYLPMVTALGGSVIAQVQPELMSLLGTMEGVTVISRSGPLPPFDLQLPLMELPRVLAATLETIPASVPYLHADPAKLARWHTALGRTGALKVGVVWAHNPKVKEDPRALLAEMVLPRLIMPGVQLFSLKKEPRPADVPVLAALGPDIIDLAPRLGDFADTAAAACAMDLVISVDTSVAHLAGALGRPVWILLPYASDWRWLRDREDSPWYPTMRLFRQKTQLVWDDVLARIAAELARVAAGERHLLWP